MASEKGTDDLAVFIISKAAVCSECGEKVEEGEMLRIEKEKPLCLACAELDHLEFLPSGDVALTRRSKKHSTVSALVLQWNRRHKRYERRGLLVESAAIERAEQECVGDATERAKAREKAAVLREKQDREYIAQFTEALLIRYPHCPADEAKTIAAHACEKYSGRVGRSASAKDLDPKKIALAVRAHIRHLHTPYDDLLLAGVDRQAARNQIAAKVDQVESSWRA